jgi:hypothetical protein
MLHCIDAILLVHSFVHLPKLPSQFTHSPPPPSLKVVKYPSSHLFFISEDIFLDEELVEDLQLEASLEDFKEHPLCIKKTA